MIRTVLPADHEAFRQSIYAGSIYQLPASEASLSVVRSVLPLLRQEFGPEEVRHAHARFPAAEVLARVGAVRRALIREGSFLQGIRSVLAGAGFHPADNATDFLRLRAILHRGHESPAAAPAYAIHRDTWYGSPQSQINWWVPLHDITEDQGIFFYPDFFAQPVENTSAGFDHDEWVRKVGWQNVRRDPDAVYPAALRDPGKDRRLHLSCSQGEIIVFSAAHCHGTSENSSGLTRFSIDFRTVHLDDHRSGRCAPNVDSQCTGSALRDYVHPAGSGS